MSADVWSVPRRVAFRFGFLYLGLYELPWLLKRPLWSDAGRKAVESIGSFEPAVRWFGHHVLGQAGALDKEYPAGGDSLFQWVRLVFLLGVAALGASVWSALDRTHLAHRRLLDLLRTYVRYGLALTMMSYGIQKVLPIQFAPPTLDQLLEPFGDFSPMGLLWKFMGFSRPYTIVAGLVEVVGAVLLFWRRTVCLGALLLTGAAANVLLLNLCFDVPVKLYSAHLLVMALFLAAPDGARVVRWLLFRQAVPLPPLHQPLPWAWVERVRPWFKVAVIGGCSFATVCLTSRQLAGGRLPAPPGLLGVWLVESYVPSPADRSAWHHVVVDERGVVMIERMDDERAWFEMTDEATTSTLRLTSATEQLALALSRPDSSHLVLDGDVGGQHVAMHLREVKKTFALTTRGFHWTQEGTSTGSGPRERASELHCIR